MPRSRLSPTSLACLLLLVTALPGTGMIPDQSPAKKPETTQQENRMGYMDLTRLGQTLRNTIDPAVFQVSASTGGLRITAARDGLFAPGGTALRASARRDLEIIAHGLAKGPGGVLDVIGHSDSHGDAAANRSETERQAAIVADVFRGAGTGGVIIQSRGQGEASPVASNQTSEGRARNRRIDIIFQANIH